MVVALLGPIHASISPHGQLLITDFTSQVEVQQGVHQALHIVPGPMRLCARHGIL